jgi:hypothetical protein
MARPLPPLAPALCGGLALLLLAGCQDEEIRHYRVPRTEAPPTRFLGAILPVGGKMWFVTVSGPAPAVTDLQPAFEQFVRGLRFPENERTRITWTLPADWHREPSRERLRYATFRAGPNALEVKVHTFGPEARNVLLNVNRWRGQIGLPPITEAELAPITREITVDGRTVTLVDMTGNSPGSAPPPATPPPPHPPGTVLPARPHFQAPAGWEPTPIGPGSMRTAAFRVSDGSHSAEVTVIPFGGPAGGLLANVNRWRGQIGLGELTEDQLPKETKTVDVDGLPAVLVDFTGPESAGDKRQRVLGAILRHDETTWFIKLQGPAELVGKQQAAFEAFVRSFRFAKPPGGTP